MKKRARRRPRAAGFTLIEVLLVLVILVILGSLVGVNVQRAQRNAQINAARAQIGGFKTPLESYQLDVGTFPSTNAGLAALSSPPSELQNSNKWMGPYMDKVPDDPWGRPYHYQYPGQSNPNSYDLWSLGPDGADGTDDDIGNWE